ncbi:MAG: porin [Bradyrhizobium sp.]|nr:porin [Bradyrhizobium sp.]
MKMVKSLILGSAAGLLAMSGAQAADLPVKAKAVEYVKVCSLYGAGFFYIPGTDTCIKLGGYLRVDTTFNGGIYDAPAWAGDFGQGNRYRDYFEARSRMALTIDTRTATEYGVVRTFGQADFQFSTLGASRNPNVLNTSLLTTTSGSQIGGGLVANNANLLDTPGGGYVAVEMVFIQFAGFTFGKSASAFATPWHGYPGNNTSFLLGGHDTVTGVNNIQYTAQFGNGVSATIGLDDPTVFHRTAVYNLATPLNTNISVQPGGAAASAFVGATGISAQNYGGVHAPTVVGNIRVDQAWGLFQISAAAHEVNGTYNSLGLSGLPAVAAIAAVPFGPSETSGHPDSKWGGSVMAALQIKNLPTGAGDDIKIDATYAKGHTKQVISTSATSPNFAMFSGSGRTGAYQSIGLGVVTDAMWLPSFAGGDNQLHLTEAYGVRGAFNHNWDPYWSTSLFGSYSAVRYDNATKAYYCTLYTNSAATGGATAKSADYSCNPDFNISQLGLVTRWTPVKNLTFSAEVMWTHLDQKFTGTSTLTNMPPKPNTTYEYKDQDTVSFNVRAQRNF